MATSGTTTFNPDFLEIAEEAFEQAGTVLSGGYDLRSARRSLNLLLTEWSNRGLNLWTVDEQSFILTPGEPVYTVANGTIDLIDHQIRINDGLTSQIDYTLTRVSVGSWATLANKTLIGRPLQVWIERTTTGPRLNLWPVPDTLQTYTLVYWRLRHMEDVGASAANTVDIPVRFIPAIIAGLALRTAIKKPELAQRVPSLKTEYEEQFLLASGEDRDRASLFVAPDLDSW